jgi:anti-sigma factor RsiW
MTCREFTVFIADYLAGDLPAETLAHFQRHLSRCDNCVQYLADYQRTVALERPAFDRGDALPPDVPDELVMAILAARRANLPE